MSTAPATLARGIPGIGAMPARRVARACLAEARYETIRMLRTPAFAIPFLGLPVLLYVLFGVVIFGAAIAKDPQAAPFVFTGFSYVNQTVITNYDAMRDTLYT